MADFDVNYGNLENSISDLSAYSGYLSNKSDLGGLAVDAASFEGPAAIFCTDLINAIKEAFQKTSEQFGTVSKALSTAYEKYKEVDGKSSKSISDSVSKILKDCVKSVPGDFDIGGAKDGANKACMMVQAKVQVGIEFVRNRPMVDTDKWVNLCCNKVNGYWLIADGNAIMDKFGGQNDWKGYGFSPGGCDNYSRLYYIYMLTGEKVPEQDLGCTAYTSRGTFVEHTHPEPINDRKTQAQVAYDYVKKGLPCVIHVNSMSGQGHWMPVIGYDANVNRDTVTLDDLYVLDSGVGKADSIKNLCRDYGQKYNYEGTGWIARDNQPGYQVEYFEKV